MEKMIFERILELTKKYFYFSQIFSKSKNKYDLHLGSLGILLQNNIKSQWLSSNMKNHLKIESCFYTNNRYSEDVFHNCFTNLYKLNENRLPFSILENYQTDIDKDERLNSVTFSFPFSTVISFSKFLSKDDCIQYFFNLQRQRKLWWKKISAFPGRFDIKEVKSDELAAEIVATFPWGNYVVEAFSSSNMKENKSLRYTDKNNLPIGVCNKMFLEEALTVLLCDSAEVTSQDHFILRLNKVISPYKCIFAVNTASNDYKKLLSLAAFLNQGFKKKNIYSILLHDTMPIEKQFQRNDEWGIPFSLKIDDHSISTGIVGVRFRDTTLTEEVHVSELNSHILSALSSHEI